MKRISKSKDGNPLQSFASLSPNANWDDFRNNHQGSDYRQLKAQIINDQGGLCAYCEKDISQLQPTGQRIEHFHSKSDTSDVTVNWALDWQNVFLVCIGGNDADQTKHPLPSNLSCDSHKDHLISKNKLDVACEGFYLNPLEIVEAPCLFDFDKPTGKLIPNQEACSQWQATSNRFSTTFELVENTIQVLNLNCQRLLDDRLEVLKAYNQQVSSARKRNDRDFKKHLVQRWFNHHWPSFFTTRRILLGREAELFLSKQPF